MKKQFLSALAATWLSVMPAYAFDAFVVQEIRLEGLERINQGTVFNYLPVEVGDKIEPDQTSQIIHALFKTGFFDDIQLAKDGDTLVVKLTERPSIGSIEVEGNVDVPTDNLLDSLKDQGLAEGMTFDRSMLEMMRNELERLYFSHGKYAVRIDTQVTELPRNRVGIKIVIEEGYFARIKEINIIGNQRYSSEDLLEQFEQTKPSYLSWVTKSDQYDKQKLAKDLENLRTFYLDRGYLNFKITSTQVSITPNKQHIFITVNIEEGEQYKLSEYDIVGNTIIPVERLHELVQLEQNEVFSRSKISDIVKLMTQVLGNEGYAFARINPVPELDEVNKTVKLTFFVEPGGKVMVRRIDFKGNIKTQDDVLRKAMLQMESAPISTSKVEGSKETLNRMGFFKEVDVETVPVPGVPDQVDLIYTVEEGSSGQLGGGLGWSDVDKLVLNFNMSNRNLFGTGKSADLTFNSSQAYTTLSLAYNNPFYTLDGMSRGFNAYYSKTDIGRTTAVSSYTTDAIGANVHYGIPISRYARMTWGAGYQNTTLKVGENAAIPQQIQDFINPSMTPGFDYANNNEDYDEFNVAFGISYNSFDRFVFPENGLSAGVSFTATIPGSDLQYYRTSVYGQYYKSLGAGFVGLLSANVGYGNGYGKTKRLPFYKNFYAGGIRSVRGFEESSLGPIDSLGNPYGGNFVATSTVGLVLPEFIAPGTRAFRTVAFVDAGQAYHVNDRSDFVEPLNPRGFRYSAGLSLTWMSPMAPLVFTVATPLNRKAGDKRNPFSFTFGTVF